MDSLRSGQTILHYRVEQKIGQGGMGEVYRAEDLKLGRHVAIKVLPASAMRDQTARQRFLREARSASALNHPNIVTIHAIEEADGCDFIVMEYVEGESLRENVARGGLTLERRPPRESRRATVKPLPLHHCRHPSWRVKGPPHLGCNGGSLSKRSR